MQGVGKPDAVLGSTEEKKIEHWAKHEVFASLTKEKESREERRKERDRGERKGVKYISR